MKYVDEKKSTNPKQFIDFRFSVQAFQKTFKTVSTNCANPDPPNKFGACSQN